jgi:hypothetical protein
MITLFHLAALLSAIAFVGSVLILTLWGLLRLMRILKHPLMPIIWAYFLVLSSVNAMFDIAFQLWAALALDAVCVVWATVMLKRARRIRATPLGKIA